MTPFADPPSDFKLTRRKTLSTLGLLLAAGAWPGARMARAGTGSGTPVEPVRFVVVTDFHHDGPECDPWMEKLFKQVGTMDNAAFSLGLGDLANKGERASLESIKCLSEHAGMPFHPSPGNHDLDESPVEGFYEEVFPNQRNYVLREKGWQWVCIDSTEGDKWREVTIAASTLEWLDQTLPELDPQAPTVLCTHFPLASEVRMCPLNADAVLARFIGHNLRGVFGGHFHGNTSSPRGDIRLTTSACVARVRDNHDRSPDKGYLVVDGDANGVLTPEFVKFDGNKL